MKAGQGWSADWPKARTTPPAGNQPVKLEREIRLVHDLTTELTNKNTPHLTGIDLGEIVSIGMVITLEASPESEPRTRPPAIWFATGDHSDWGGHPIVVARRGRIWKASGDIWIGTAPGWRLTSWGMSHLPD
jgi:hypothetical protein